jgi:hypothetical protein
VNDERGSSEPALTRYRISEAGGESTGTYGIEVEDEWGDFVRYADVQRLFTREDAEALMDAVCPLGKHRNYDYEGLAARIAALLPPDQSP